MAILYFGLGTTQITVINPIRREMAQTALQTKALRASWKEAKVAAAANRRRSRLSGLIIE